MPRGVAIPKALAETVLRMIGDGIEPKKIKQLTNVSIRQQQQIIKIWEETGEVPKPRLRVGRTREVSEAEAYYLLGCINNTCDSYSTCWSTPVCYSHLGQMPTMDFALNPCSSVLAFSHSS
ncbi:hypothetical protein ARMSODRAFT_1028233 [Armillaria solidipes]|uniref:Paired domain-containing protein n=1 Tax=Armillaria solidipes TaxID=1076256 RepID=A0A2H3ANV8_9AGAR|nr:hypothetical protein ARMSODRAFT_1028233 [Armillaria solidipes]